MDFSESKWVECSCVCDLVWFNMGVIFYEAEMDGCLDRVNCADGKTGCEGLIVVVQVNREGETCVYDDGGMYGSCGVPVAETLGRMCIFTIRSSLETVDDIMGDDGM